MEKAAQEGVNGMRMDYLFAECLGYAECGISWARPVADPPQNAMPRSWLFDDSC